MRLRIEEAKQGVVSREIESVARVENMEPETLRLRVADGTVVILRNCTHDVKPVALGAGTGIKVNANIGSSSSRASVAEEVAKMRCAVDSGADTIMDLSTGGDIEEIRLELLRACPVPLGTVPVYDMGSLARERGVPLYELGADDILKVVENHCRQGVDFLTLHCGVTRRSVAEYLDSNRLAGAVSRGGTIMMEWIRRNDAENPLYERFDDVLELAGEYDVALSLGDGFRPGALHDATDRPQLQELVTLGELVIRARERDVGVFVEGPGHVPLDQIAANMQVQKSLCKGAPFYVLGPLVTDVSPGYDHISGAIGGAVAGMAGADFLCYVTPAEHLRLPSLDDVKEGVIASRIAAHAADIARGHPGAIEWDHEISRAKTELDWEKMIGLCIDPVKAGEYRKSLPATQERLCSMCGEYCAIKRTRELGAG